MIKYLGKYRINCEWDRGSLEPIKEDLFISCYKDAQIYRAYKNKLAYYRPSRGNSEVLARELIGLGGCKLAKEFHDNKYRSFFINTSYDDLSQLNVSDSLTYHVPSSKGCAKKREVALAYARDYYGEMTGKLIDTHPTSKIFLVHYTLGGGTGGGLSNFFMATLRNKLKEMGKKDATIIAVVAKPRKFESYQLQYNAKKSLEELYTLVGANIVDQYYIINNDSRDDLDDINMEHYMLFDRWIEGEGANNSSNADESERLDLFKSKGQSLMFTFDATDIDSFRENCKEAYDNSIYCHAVRKPKMVGYALYNGINQEEAIEVLEQTIGFFPNDHSTPTKVSNIVMVSGVIDEKTNKAIENSIVELANKKAGLINGEVNDEIEEVKIETVNVDSNKKNEKKESMASIDDILKFFS